MKSVAQLSERLVCVLATLVFVTSVFLAVPIGVSAQEIDCDSLSYAERIASPCAASLSEECASLTYAEFISSPCAVNGGAAPGMPRDGEDPDGRGAEGSSSAPLVAGIVGMVAVGALLSTAARRANLAPLGE